MPNSPARTMQAEGSAQSQTGGFTPTHQDSHEHALSQSAAASTTVSGEPPSVVEVLRYIKKAFIDENVLDAIPVEAAANLGAFHAWRSHRKKSPPILRAPPSAASIGDDARKGDSPMRLASGRQAVSPLQVRTKRPEEWNWEGVWEERVKKATQASISESVLFGNANSTEDLVGQQNPYPCF